MRIETEVLGAVPYGEALALQERVAADVRRGARGDVLLLLEHPPTVTLGRRGSALDLLLPPAELEARGLAVVRVGRGGGATYHGPGQLVGYPIVRVPRGGRGVRRLVGAIERTLIAACARLGVAAVARPGAPGLWAGGRKIASIGLEIRAGVSRHGFALNVAMDLAPFGWIVPCRAPGLAMGDLAAVAAAPPTLAAAVDAVIGCWRDAPDIAAAAPPGRGDREEAEWTSTL